MSEVKKEVVMIQQISRTVKEADHGLYILGLESIVLASDFSEHRHVQVERSDGRGFPDLNRPRDCHRVWHRDPLPLA